MLDPRTEGELYRLYRTYFQKAETERRWNLWDDTPWDLATTTPSEALAEAALASYREDVFLPDYSAKALHILRSSRGRGWFLTRWAYEEGKHLIALSEWLTRAGVRTDAEMRDLTETILAAYAWRPELDDPLAVLADSLAWEANEIARFAALKTLAQAENDGALAAICDRILADEEAHQAFFREALQIIGAAYPDAVADAVRRIAALQDDPASGAALLSLTSIVDGAAA